MRLIALVLVAILAFSAKAYNPPRPWIFFDLGNTLVDTSDSSHIKYLNNAHEYLIELRQMGYKIGVLSNVPEKWGKTNDEKLVSLKNFIKTRWDDDIEFEWELIDQFYFSPDEKRRKPNPYLFAEAIALASPCPTLFQGETLSEIDSAKKAGMAARIVGTQLPNNKIKERSFFMPLSKIKGELEKIPHQNNCFDHINN